MIEQKIQELIDALNTNTAALKNLLETADKTEAAKKTTKNPAAPKPEVAKPEEKTVAPETTAAAPEVPDVAQWRALAQKVLDAKQKARLDEINSKYKLARITAAVGTPQAAQVYADLKAAADACAAA